MQCWRCSCASLLLRSCKAYTRRDQAEIDTVRTQQIVMAAVVVDERILQRECVEAAGRPGVPRDLFRLRCQPALRRVFLDHDHMLMASERISDAIDVERLERVTRNERHRLALSFEGLRELYCLLRDHAVGKDANVAAACQVAQLSEDPRIDRLFGEIGLACLADAKIDRPFLLRGAVSRRFRAFGW